MAGRERMIVAISLRPLLIVPHEAQSELWNPTGGVTVLPPIATHANHRERFVEHAQSIRTQIASARTPAFVKRLLSFMKNVGTWPITIRRQGCLDSPIMLLSSWRHVDLSKLTLGDESDSSASNAVLVQHELRYVQWLPTPWILPPPTCICHKSSDGGYWLEANLTEQMWDRISSLDFNYNP